MSRFTYTPLVSGDTRAASQVNTIYAAFESAGASLNAFNLAEEGIDRSRFDLSLPMPGRVEAAVMDGANRTTMTNTGLGSWANLVLGGSTIQSGAITLVANDILRIRALVALESTVSGGQGLEGMFGMVIARVESGVTTRIVSTERYHTKASTDTINHETLRSLHAIEGPATIDNIKIMYTCPGVGIANVGAASLICTLFRRQTT